MGPKGVLELPSKNEPTVKDGTKCFDKIPKINGILLEARQRTEKDDL